MTEARGTRRPCPNSRRSLPPASRWPTGSCMSASTTRPRRSACRWPTCPGSPWPACPALAKPRCSGGGCASWPRIRPCKSPCWTARSPIPRTATTGSCCPAASLPPATTWTGSQPAARRVASDHAGPLGLAAHPSGHRSVLGDRPDRRLPAGAGLRGRKPHLRDRVVPQGPRPVRQQRLVPHQAGEGGPLPRLSDRVCDPETNRRCHPHRHPRCLSGRACPSGCGPWMVRWPPWATRSANTPTWPPPT